MGRHAKKLTKIELKEFKQILLAMREDILAEINHISQDARQSSKEASGDLSSYTLHMADMASDNFQRELNLELASNERGILTAIDEALERMKSGTFAICTGCHQPIAKMRLKVMPYSQLCKRCQEKREKGSQP